MERIESANRCALIVTRDRLARPRPGLWTVAAAHRALEKTLDGIGFDPLSFSFRSGGPREGPLPGSGRIAVAEHIYVLRSIRERGHGWITTKGMEKFGLPNLEAQEVPPDLAGSLAPILDGVAQVLVGRILDLADRSGKPPREIDVEPEITVRAADLAAAFGKEANPEDRGSAVLRLSWTGRGRGKMEPFVSIDPPEGFGDGRGVWFHRLLEDLQGSPGKDKVVHACGKDDALEAAHRKAVVTLGIVKERFGRGLRPGEVLYVKHGFPHEGGSEFMWVAVNTWKGLRLQGQLSNAPTYCADLKAGDPIELGEDEVYDWVIEKADGSIEGGFTNVVLGGGGG